MFNKILTSIALALCVPSLCASNSVDEILATISANNADIKATASQLYSDSIEISSTNYLEDPSVDFEYLFGQVGDKWAIGVSQGFEWPGIYHSRRKANKSRLTALAYSASMKRLEVLYQAKLYCYDIINLNKQIAVQRDLHDRYSDMYKHYSTAYDQGEITILDINKLRIELVNIEQRIDELTVTRNGVYENLVALNAGIEINTALLDEITEYPADELTSLESYLEQYRAIDPETNFYDQMSNAYKAEKSVARMGWLPRFGIGYKYSNELGDGFNGLTIGATIPLFSNRKKVKAAKAQEVASLYTSQVVETSNTARIKSAFAKSVSLRSRLAAYEKAVDLNRNQELLQKALDSRQISLLDYIQEMIYFVDAQNTLLNIEYDYHTTIADLNRYNILTSL